MGFYDLLGVGGGLAAGPLLPPPAVELSSLPYVNPPAGVVTYVPAFRIRHEIDLSEWDTVDSGISRVTPGLVSTVGKLRVAVTDRVAKYAAKGWLQQYHLCHYRFYVDLTGLTMGEDESFVIHEVATEGTPPYLIRVAVEYASSDFQLRLWATDDNADEYNNTPVIVSQGVHWIEIGMNRPTATSEDGAVVMYIDGYQAVPILNLDIYDIWENITEFRLGAVAGVDVGTTGYIDFDEVVLLDENRSSYL